MPLTVISTSVNVTLQAASGNVTSVASSTSSVQLLASNSSRKGGTIYNDGSNNLFVKFGVTASTTSYTVKIPATGYYELPSPIYTGEIDGIWDVASGSARITELS